MSDIKVEIPQNNRKYWIIKLYKLYISKISTKLKV